MAMTGQNTDYYQAAVLKRRALEQIKQEIDSLEGRKTVDTAALLKTVEVASLSLQPAEPNAARVLRVRKGLAQTKVLIEYKTLPTTGESDCERTMRLQRLANLVDLLRITPKPSQCRILDCEDVVRHDTESDERYGLVFGLPTRVTSLSQLRFSPLHELLRAERQNTVPQTFTLEQRFRLASRLANSVTHIHFGDWLHRDITSENIICFHSEGHASIEEPYLSGFTFSRPDNLREVSEYDVNTTSNLYKHAHYQMPRPKHKFRRSYDTYSLGIVLIEIGFWKQIRAFWKPGLDAKAFHEHLASSVVPLLGFYMGEKYRNAVSACLDVEKLEVQGDEGRRYSCAFSRVVAKLLESCET
jgi:serine/threonine protein kinase